MTVANILSKMTTLKGKTIAQRYTQPGKSGETKRACYLPIHPSPRHPDSGLLLEMADDITLGKASNICLRQIYEVHPKMLKAYDTRDRNVSWEHWKLSSESLDLVFEKLSALFPERHLPGKSNLLLENIDSNIQLSRSRAAERYTPTPTPNPNVAIGNSNARPGAQSYRDSGMTSSQTAASSHQNPAPRRTQAPSDSLIPSYGAVDRQQQPRGTMTNAVSDQVLSPREERITLMSINFVFRSQLARLPPRPVFDYDPYEDFRRSLSASIEQNERRLAELDPKSNNSGSGKYIIVLGSIFALTGIALFCGWLPFWHTLSF
jgi:hypothetical protein